MTTVSDILVNKTFKAMDVDVYIDTTHNYVFAIGEKYRRAYKVTSTDNNGTIILDFPMSWARCKLIKAFLKTPYKAGNIRLRGSRRKATATDDSINEWLERVA